MFAVLKMLDNINNAIVAGMFDDFGDALQYARLSHIADSEHNYEVFAPVSPEPVVPDMSGTLS